MHTLARDVAAPGTRSGSSAGSRGALWTGRILSTFAVLFLLFDSVGKLLEVPPVVAGTAGLGYPVATVVPLGVILLLSVVAYAIPGTSVLGAVLLTGYLGGAIATHLRVGNPLFSHTLFPVYVALVVWGGLFLRESRLRALLPWRDRD
jgi:hypothetical protein